VRIAGLVRVVVRPSLDDEARRFERFLACWAVLGVLLFCLSPHNQARLLAPMIPPAAMLAGRELDRLARRLSARVVAAVTSAAIVVMLGFFVWEFHHRLVRRAAGRGTVGRPALARPHPARGAPAPPPAHVAASPFALPPALTPH